MNTPTKVEAPTLGSSAMLVEFSVSLPTATKKDRGATADITIHNNADSNAATVNKKLFAQSKDLAETRKLVGDTRNHLHYARTLPWGDNGARLLTTENYFEYNHQMSNSEHQFWQHVDSFCDNYTYEVAKAQASLGDMFDPNDYPHVEEIRSKFAWRLNYTPLPSAGDFRVDIGNEAQQQLRDDYDKFYGNQMQKAMNDLWTRLYDRLTKMSERLTTDGEHRHKKTFRDTLVTNLVDVVDLLQTCNITKNTQMENMRMDLEDTLRGVTPDALRANESLRINTKAAIDKAIMELPSLDI